MSPLRRLAKLPASRRKADAHRFSLITSESHEELFSFLNLTLVEIAEADSIAQVARILLESLKQTGCKATLLIRFPSHAVICAIGSEKSQIQMTSMQQTLPILTQGTIPFSEAPTDIREIFDGQLEGEKVDHRQLFLSAPNDVDGVAACLIHIRAEDEIKARELLHRAAQSRIVSLYLLDAAQQQTYTDDLTGLANRRYFVRRLAEEVDRAERHGRKLALIILDLDHLKQLNDSLGHQTGDEALREIAVRLRQSVRRIDTVCRYAGDEFCVIMPDAGCETCQALLRRLHLSLNLSKSAKECPTGTISMGAAIFPQHAQNPEFLLRVADNALREAKKVRGTFVLAESPQKTE
jgi:diguanylate cyclase (GGDEF)-like protein